MKQKTLKFLFFMSVLPIIIAPFVQDFDQLIRGFIDILSVRSTLVTDYIAIGGLGATLLNVGLVSLFSIILIKSVHAQINGTAIASVFLMGSFAFFGKNILNVLPIIIGTAIYSKVFKVHYRNMVHISLLATSFAPAFNEVFFMVEGPTLLKAVLATFTGISIGFLIKPIARHVFKAHEGYNLYNTGFAVGLLATIYAAVFRALGFNFEPLSVVYVGESNAFVYALLILFTSFLILGLIINRKSFNKLIQLFSETGLHGDFLTSYGLGVVLVNMALNGFLALIYILVVARGSLNGPIIGGILTVVGFSGYGKTIVNTLPLYIGVILSSFTNTRPLHDTSILLVALFGTSLAPISGTFGITAGIIAGYLNAAVAINVSSIHAGLNLYNTGFSSGIVAAIVLPVFRKIRDYKESRL